MAVGITAILVFLFYLSAIPVEIAVKARTFPEIGFGAGFAIFEGRFALRQAEKRANGEKKHLPWSRFYLGWEKTRALPALKYLIRHTKLEKLSLTGTIGASDAARTALICGGCEAVKAAIMPFRWADRLELALSPDFSGGGSSLRLHGMVSIPAGHIMLAALIGAVYLTKGRIAKWKSTRLRIS